MNLSTEFVHEFATEQSVWVVVTQFQTIETKYEIIATNCQSDYQCNAFFFLQIFTPNFKSKKCFFGNGINMGLILKVWKTVADLDPG